MFRKIKANKEKKLDLSVNDLMKEELFDPSNNMSENKPSFSTQNEEENSDILKIKSEIDNKLKKPRTKGMIISKNDHKIESNSRDDNKSNSVKKVFLSESLIENAKSPEELKKILGTNREEMQKIQLEKRKKLIEFQKDMFSLPETLNVIKENNDDHVDNIVKLSAAGISFVYLRLNRSSDHS